MKAVWVALALLLTPAAALAQTSDHVCAYTPHPESPLFVGVTQQTIDMECRTPAGPLHSTAHVVKVNLGAANASFETSSFPAGQTAFQFDLPTAFLLRTN